MKRLLSFAKELSAMALIQMLTLTMTFGFIAWGIASPKAAASVITALDGFWQSTALPFIERQVAGYPGWGKVAYNQVKTQVAGVHTLVLAISLITSSLVVGIFVGVRSLTSRLTLAVVRALASIWFGFLLLVLNIASPENYAWLAGWAETGWRSTLKFVESIGGGDGSIQSVINTMRTGIRGSHLFMMAIVGFGVSSLITFIWDKFLWLMRFVWVHGRRMFRRQSRPAAVIPPPPKPRAQSPMRKPVEPFYGNRKPGHEHRGRRPGSK
ncbi:MAG: hypothetical protein KBE09_01860 [Candidatus Pacebacteria bacterium]|nr:hypothetical protein [Candidatus Paceibacterota bacterium]